MADDAGAWVYYFGDDLPEGLNEPKMLLGGKGASLHVMTCAGLNVPPGFTISTEACRWFFEHGDRWPPGLEGQIRTCLARLERDMGRAFGRGKEPLLVSVRSGAAVSMPGMMDTILNCGLHPGLAEELGDTQRFWHLYIQFTTMFARVVAGIEPERFESSFGNVEPDRDLAFRYLALYEEAAGRPFPTDPWRILVECIDTVFRSWNNERAIAYRRRNDIRGLAGTAVNVQAMFPSRVSGILFTQDPNDLAASRMVLEASWGLGEAIVSGDVTPDRFIVDREDFGRFETFLGDKVRAVAAAGDEGGYDRDAVCLTPEQVGEIAELGLRVEEHWGIPVDIEWGLAEGRFALLQCRAIRGLDIARDVEVGRKKEIGRLRGLVGEKRRVWVTHNLGETLRTPTPLTWDIIRRFMSGDGGFGRMYRDLGYRPAPVVRTEGFLELICGRIYADPERQAQLFYEGIPMTYDMDAVRRDKSLLDRAPGKFVAEKADSTFLARLPGLFLSLYRTWRNQKRLRRTAKEAFEGEAVPPFLEYVRQKRGQDLSKLSSAEVIAEFGDRCRRVLDEFGTESLKPGYIGGLALGELSDLLRQVLGRNEGNRFTAALTSALEGDVTFEQNVLLHKVADGRAGMEEFLEKFGHRTQDEMELSQPRYREDRGYLVQMVERFRSADSRSPEGIHQENVRRREQAEKELPEALKLWGGSSFREQIDGMLATARELLPYRENGKHYLMMGYELIRLAILELSRRWDLGNGVFFLHLEELERFEADRERLTEEIARRKVRWQSAQRLDMPDVIDSEELEKLGLPQQYEAATEFEGDAVAAGVAAGPAAIVFDPREAGDIGTGYILVCPSTDPGWTPLFTNARGLVVERGGILSHGAIVARDFGIPAVVCPGATSLIPRGAAVRVDGNQGRVTILEEAEKND